MDSFGSTLRIERQKKNLSIEQISNHLKISKTILRAIEEEDNDSLPSPVYVKGFIRSYSELLKIEPEPLVHSFNVFISEELDPFQQPTNREVPEEKPIESPSFVTFSNRTLPLLVLGGLAVVIGLVYFFTPEILNSSFTSKIKTPVSPIESKTLERGSSLKIETETLKVVPETVADKSLILDLKPELENKMGEVAEGLSSSNTSREKTELIQSKTQYIGLNNLRVSVRAVEAASFSVQLDEDAKSKNYTLEAKKEITLSAQKKMILNFSDSENIEVKYGKYGFRNLKNTLKSNRLYFTKAR